MVRGMIDLLLSMLVIKAVNPGYTINGTANTGEMIVIENLSDKPILATGIKLNYTNSSGNSVVLYEFPENSEIASGSLLLRLASSPEAEQADANYTKTLAFAAGPLELVYEDTTVDSVCWNGKTGCYAKFTSDKPTTLVRNADGTFEHLEDFEITYDAEKPGLILPEEGGMGGGEQAAAQCKGMVFSEILSYYELNAGEQFVELYNAGDGQILLDGCSLRYKNKYYTLNGVVQPEEYFARYGGDFVLTKNPTTQNIIELIDVNGEVVDTLIFYNGQKKAMSYAQFGYDANGKEQWLQTYMPTPGEANNFQKFKTCTDGKVINEETGNCVKATTLDTELEPCPAGKYRNPLTGRCKSYEVETEKVCADGYYLNPETNRCKKITDNTGAEYALEEKEYTESSTFVALWALIGVVVAGIIYVIWQYRKEIKALITKMASRLGGQS